MSKSYTFKTAAFKTTTADARKLNAQEILIYPGDGDASSRINILELIKNNSGGSGDVNLDDIENSIFSVSQIVADHVDDTTLHISQEILDNIEDYNTNKSSFLTKVVADTYYAPTSISSTISSHTGNSSLHLNSTQIADLATFNTNKNNYLLKSVADSTYATTASLSNYVLQSSLTSTLSSYVLQSSLSETLSLYTTTSALNTALRNYVKTSTLASYPTTATLESTLSNYVKTSTLNTTLSGYASKTAANTFTETNTFNKSIAAAAGLVSNSDIFVSGGILTFEDVTDGTVTTRTGATGYQYVTGMPTAFNNGMCYDIGAISNTTDFSTVSFNGNEHIIQTCEIWFTTPATPPTTHKWPSGTYWIDSSNGAAPILLGSKNYRIVLRREPSKILASVAYMY